MNDLLHDSDTEPQERAALRLDKVVSGGQTGVDQGALRAAAEFGIGIGGWCPPGRVCEGGLIPDIFPLEETPQERSEAAPAVPRSLRTEWNVRDSDATLVLWPSALQTRDAGTRWAIACAARFRKPLLTCDPGDVTEVERAREWIRRNAIRTLNVAGPSERTSPGIGSSTERFINDLFSSSLCHESRALLPEVDRNDNPRAEPIPWWINALRLLIRRTGAANFVYALAALLLSLTVLLVVSVRFLNFHVDGGQIYLGEDVELGAHATVDAIAAFQTSGVRVKKGEVLRLTPDGRVTVAIDHQIHLAEVVKGLIVQRSPPARWPPFIRRRYPEVKLTESNVFYRDWVGPEGENTPGDILEECKLREDLGWGALMFIILPREPSAREDPFEVLKAANASADDLVPLPHAMTVTASSDGWLAFIINEAVMSPSSPSNDSRMFYGILKKASEQLVSDPRHQIPLRSIPLLWYADNAGAFRVVIEVKH